MADEVYTTREDGEMVDAIAYSHYGHTEGKVEAIMAANPRLADYGVSLPRGTTLVLPDLNEPESTPKISNTVNLWD